MQQGYNDTVTSVIPLSRTCSRPAYSSRMSRRGLGAFTEIVMSEERWVPVIGYEGCYEVSDHGSVRSLDRVVKSHHHGSRRAKCRLMKIFPDTIGYLCIRLSREGDRKNHLVHRLVARAFIGVCPDGLQVNHINGRKYDNRVENLEYVTRSENMLHAYALGLKKPTCGRVKPVDQPVRVRGRLTLES